MADTNPVVTNKKELRIGFENDIKKFCAILIQSDNDVNTAIKKYLLQYEDALPSDTNVDMVAESIISTAKEFCKLEENYEQLDFREELRRNISEMRENQAYVYLASVSVMIKSCNAAVLPNGGAKLPTEEEIKAEIESKLNDSSGKSVAECIDELVNEVCDDDMKVFVYSLGNKEMLEVMSDPLKMKDATELGKAIVELTDKTHEKADKYAMLSCISYGQILEGRIENVSAADIDPRIVTAIASVAMEKQNIILRYLKGELDEEETREFLERAEVVFKAVLGGILKILAILGIGLIAIKWVAILGLAGTAVGDVFGIVSFAALVCLFDEVEYMLDDLACYLVDMGKKAVKYVKGESVQAVDAQTDGEAVDNDLYVPAEIPTEA